MQCTARKLAMGRTGWWLFSINLGFMALMSSGSVNADVFHYSNILIGDRAMGLGGAYGGVSDDASGIFYNPAGLAFALSSDVSGSANTYFNRTVTYKDTIFDDDFVEKSSSSVPSFFGGVQKLDKYVKGLVAGFALYQTDSDIKDQDDLIKNKQDPTGANQNITIRRFHRSVNQQAGTSFGAIGLAYRLSPAFGIGLGVGYFTVDELVQEYQDAIQTTNSGELWTVLNSNLRQQLTAIGIQPTLGLQYAMGTSFVFGLTIKPSILISEELSVDSEARTQVFDGAGLEGLESEQAVTGSLLSIQNIEERKITEDPLGGWPTEIRFGTAWFVSARMLLTFDVTYHTAVSSAGAIDAFQAKFDTNGDGTVDATVDRKLYKREAVTNFASGIEYYLTPSLPVRFGLFTNNDARPEVDEKAPDRTANRTCGTDPEYFKEFCGQPDHIDYLGSSLFLAWVTPNSQLSFGFVVQTGDGKAQKVGDHKVQDVEALASTFAFSASTNL